MSRLSPARAAALEATAQARRRDAFVRDILPGILDAHELAGSDRALATLIAVGVVQTSGSLDEVLDRSMRSPRDVKAALRDALRIPVFEMLYLGRDAYAAVDQGVQLAARMAPRARGLANAVLRQAARTIEELLPLTGTDAQTVALRYGFPPWLAQRLTEQQGAQAACAFMEASNEAPPVFAAVNALRATDDEVASALARAGIAFERCERVPGCLRLAEAASVGHAALLALIDEGKLVVSDAAAQEVAFRVAQQAGDSLLEVGAGRGTKTVLVQSAFYRMHGCQIERLVCVDNVEGKARLLRERAAACGVQVSEVLTADGADLGAVLPDERFSTVFIDAPCTGLGTLRRHPEIRWRIRPESITEAAALDARLLASAADRVAPGGALAYATCTVAPEENEGAVRAFLTSEAGASFKLAAEDGLWSSRLAPGGCDGHFCAHLRKR